MTPRAELAEAVCRKAWADLAEGGTACPGCGNRYDLPIHGPSCPLAAWHAAAKAPRGWTVRRKAQPAFGDWDGCVRLRVSPVDCSFPCSPELCSVYPTIAAAREARARYTTGDGWRVCRVVKKKDGG